MPRSPLFDSFRFILVINAVFSYSPDKTQFQISQHEFQNALRESQMPLYGSCWRYALVLNLLLYGCNNHLTTDVQRRMDFHFFNCLLLEKTDQNTYPCDDNAYLSVCLLDIGIKWFINFLPYTQSMCYFLQNQLLHEKIENTIVE